MGICSLQKPIYPNDLPNVHDKLEKGNELRQIIADFEVLNLESHRDLSTIKEKPLLLFAGEACHNQYFSTVHGAYLSGVEQAKKIVCFYTLKN